jgi:flagellar hook protein FlgE
MGIYGALSTAVTGLRAQSFALENISGNIANSQTTGFKRVDTDFVDLIPDMPSRVQTSGSVLANSRATNTQQGDIKSVGNSTYMAVNGDGFFVVEAPIGRSDNASIFAGVNYYTRRGDFDLNKDGYLVNGSGYFLKGLAVDPATGNISSSLPDVIKISNSVLPAQPTTRVNYQLNLPQLPQNAQYMESRKLGSEIFRPQDFKTIAIDQPGTATGTSAVTGDASTAFAAAGDTLTVQVGSATPVTFTFTDSGGTSGTNIDLTASTTIDDIITAINGGLTGASVAISGGKLVLTGGNLTDDILVTDSTTGLGFANGLYKPDVSQATQLAERVTTVRAADSDEFLTQSISGGSVTVYAANGAPANVQLRWAKIASTEVGGVDRWNLFYLSDGRATGTEPMWTNVGTDFNFAADGSLNPAISDLELTNLKADGVTVGTVKLNFGDGGLTQFADTNGRASVSTIGQNGYGVGQYLSVAINDAGRVVVTYDNGKQVEVAQVVTAEFNAPNQLKRMDGGIFAATSDSGDPIFDTSGGVVSSSIESSNTDISEEFTKLIVTQQAYAAGTRIVSTADQMLQEALNMVR